MQLFNTRVNTIKQIAPAIIELQVQLLNPPDMKFQGGQFMEFKIGPAARSYSIASVPQNTNFELRFCIELVADGVGSAFVSSRKPGDHIAMEGPFGIFTVKDFLHDVFFVATGVGVSPFLSMIPDMLARGFSRQITLLFGVRQEMDIIYQTYFKQLARRYKNFNYLVTLTGSEPEWRGLTGRVTLFLKREYDNFPNRHYYICGGMEMVRDTRKLLLSLGQPLSAISLEVFN